MSAEFPTPFGLAVASTLGNQWLAWNSGSLKRLFVHMNGKNSCGIPLKHTLVIIMTSRRLPFLIA